MTVVNCRSHDNVAASQNAVVMCQLVMYTEPYMSCDFLAASLNTELKVESLLQLLQPALLP